MGLTRSHTGSVIDLPLNAAVADIDLAHGKARRSGGSNGGPPHDHKSAVASLVWSEVEEDWQLTTQGGSGLRGEGARANKIQGRKPKKVYFRTGRGRGSSWERGPIANSYPHDIGYKENGGKRRDRGQKRGRTGGRERVGSQEQGPRDRGTAERLQFRVGPWVGR